MEIKVSTTIFLDFVGNITHYTRHLRTTCSIQNVYDYIILTSHSKLTNFTNFTNEKIQIIWNVQLSQKLKAVF